MHQTCLDYLFKEQVEETLPFEAYNECVIIQNLCAQLGIDQSFVLSQQPIQTLSGGEKVKLQLLKLVYKNCDFYVLDEPTNDLDLSTLSWLEQFIQGLRVPVLFVSHDETLLRHCANRILHIEQRNKKSKVLINDVRVDYDTYIIQRHAKREKAVQIAKKEKQEYQKKQEKLNDLRNAVHAAQNSISRQDPHHARLLKKKMHTFKAIERRFAGEDIQKVDSVEEGIDVFFEPVHGIAQKVILEATFAIMIGERVLIEESDYHIYGKDKIVMIGNNGCGKTQWMKQLYERLRTRSDLKIGYMPQQYEERMHPEQTPISFLCDHTTQEEITRSRELLGRMNFTRDEMLHQVTELSEGQKAKLYLLKFIKQGCNVLLLDEPTRNLSPLSAPLVRNLLKEYDGCIIAITHDRLLMEEVFSTVWEIKNCQIQKGAIK